MINIFNRVKLSSTFDERQRQKIANALIKNDIPYKLKIKNPSSYSLRPVTERGSIGSYGIHEKNRFEFIFYVNKCDYDHAYHILYTE